MKKLISLATLISIFVLPQLSSAQGFQIQPEPDYARRSFEDYSEQLVRAMAPKDAFAQSEACAVADSRLVNPVPINQAQEMLNPCIQALSKRYGMNISLAVEYIGKSLLQTLVMRLPQLTAVDNEAFRDLNHALRLRNNRLLGHPIELRREALPSHSAVQKTVDSCIMTLNVRRVESGDDFIRHYGGCLHRAAELKIKALKQSPGHKMGVMVLSSADKSTMESMNGSVSVNTEKGPVKILMMAYSETVYLP